TTGSTFTAFSTAASTRGVIKISAGLLDKLPSPESLRHVSGGGHRAALLTQRSRHILSRAANRHVPKSTVEFHVLAAMMPSAGNTHLNFHSGLTTSDRAHCVWPYNCSSRGERHESQVQSCVGNSLEFCSRRRGGHVLDYGIRTRHGGRGQGHAR